MASCPVSGAIPVPGPSGGDVVVARQRTSSANEGAGRPRDRGSAVKHERTSPDDDGDRSGDECDPASPVSRVPRASHSRRSQAALTRVRSACENCHQVKIKCSESRPCTRCIRYGLESSCTPAPHLQPRYPLMSPTALGPTPSYSPYAAWPPAQSSPPGAASSSSSSRSPSDCTEEARPPPLPLAAANTMRVFNEQFFQTMFAIHRTFAAADTRSGFVIATMAHMVHLMSYMSVDYNRVLSEFITGSSKPTDSGTARTLPPSPCALSEAAEDAHEALHTRDLLAVLNVCTLPSPAAVGLPAPHTHAAHGAPNLLTNPVSSARLSRSVAAASIPLPIQLHPNQQAAAFLEYYLQPQVYNTAYSSGPAYPSSDEYKELHLPPIDLIGCASDSERRVAAILNSWRNLSAVKSILRRLKARGSFVDMELCLHGERLRCARLPFGVSVFPLHPRPYSVHRSWGNHRLAALLGYSFAELQEILNVRRAHFGLYHPDSLDVIQTAPLAACAAGKTAITIPIKFIRKDRSVIQTVMSVLLRYADCQPIYSVNFIQPVPAPSLLPLIAPPYHVMSTPSLAYGPIAPPHRGLSPSSATVPAPPLFLASSAYSTAIPAPTLSAPVPIPAISYSRTVYSAVYPHFDTASPATACADPAVELGSDPFVSERAQVSIPPHAPSPSDRPFASPLALIQTETLHLANGPSLHAAAYPPYPPSDPGFAAHALDSGARP